MIRPRGTAWIRGAIAVLAALMVVVGCGHDKEEAPVDESLTEASARTRIIDYLEETAATLPRGVHFSLQSDGENGGQPFKERPSPWPCYGGHRDEGGPHQAMVSYWVVGVPPGESARYFDLIRSAWIDRGWWLNPKSTSTRAYFATPDHYTFQLYDAGKGDGWVSVKGTSPCFPQSGVGGAGPLQTDITGPR